MKTQLRPLLFLTIFLISCGNEKLHENIPVAEEIIAEVEGIAGNLYFTESENVQTGIITHFIEMNVDSSKLATTDRGKFYTASYCATQLFRRLDSETIENNTGINIIFDGQEDIANRKKYFFDYHELNDAWKAFDNIDRYLKCLAASDTLNAIAQIDMVSTDLNWSDLNSRIKAKIGHPIKILHMYEHYEQTNKAGTTRIPCYSISTTVFRQDSSKVSLGFLIPRFGDNHKIINIQPKD